MVTCSLVLKQKAEKFSPLSPQLVVPVPLLQMVGRGGRALRWGSAGLWGVRVSLRKGPSLPASTTWRLHWRQWAVIWRREKHGPCKPVWICVCWCFQVRVDNLLNGGSCELFGSLLLQVALLSAPFYLPFFLSWLHFFPLHVQIS